MNATFLVKAHCLDPNYCGCASGIPSCRNWHAGDLISVQNEGFQWGSKEGPPLFVLVEVTGKDKSDLVQYLGPWCSGFIPESGMYRAELARSKWKYVEASGVLYNKETGEIKYVPDDL